MVPPALTSVARLRAEVAELADALDSGSSARKGVGVQIPPSAPLLCRAGPGSASAPANAPRLPGPPMAKEDQPSERVVAQNRRARHDYEILETVEAGLVLTGTEVKSLRAGTASLVESYATVEGSEAVVRQLHIPPYEQGNRWNPDPVR